MTKKTKLHTLLIRLNNKIYDHSHSCYISSWNLKKKNMPGGCHSTSNHWMLTLKMNIVCQNVMISSFFLFCFSLATMSLITCSGKMKKKIENEKEKKLNDCNYNCRRDTEQIFIKWIKGWSENRTIRKRINISKR